MLIENWFELVIPFTLLLKNATTKSLLMTLYTFLKLKVDGFDIINPHKVIFFFIILFTQNFSKKVFFQVDIAEHNRWNHK